MVVTVSPKGQITIPQEVRERLGIQPHMDLELSCTADGRITLVPADGLNKGQRAMALLRQIPNRGLSADEILSMTRGED